MATVRDANRLLWQVLRQSLCPLSLQGTALEEKLKCSQGCKGIFLPTLWRQELKEFSVWVRSQNHGIVWFGMDVSRSSSPTTSTMGWHSNHIPTIASQLPCGHGSPITLSMAGRLWLWAASMAGRLCSRCGGEMLYLSVSRAGIFYGATGAVSKSGALTPAAGLREQHFWTSWQKDVYRSGGNKHYN